MKRLASSLVAAMAFFAAHDARASKPIHVVSIWYSSDTTNKVDVEMFESCLTQTSSFATTWSSQWNVGPYTHHPAIVLTTPPPNPLRITTSLIAAMNDGMTHGKIPPPTGDNDTVYVVHSPANIRNEDDTGARLCYESKYCAEHWYAQAPAIADAGGGFQYQIALVPIDCPSCGGGLASDTFLTFHELAESAADQGTASFEVADACEADPSSLVCCGVAYDIQFLDNPGGPGKCGPILATGSKCACSVTGAACADNASCCDGLVCQQNTCCFENGQKCFGPNDCCGALTCSPSGQCTCVADGDVCQRNGDCCGGDVCDGKTKRCVPAPLDDAGADGGSGGDGGAGCSCRTTFGEPGATRGLAGIALALFLARRRSRK